MVKISRYVGVGESDSICLLNATIGGMIAIYDISRNGLVVNVLVSTANVTVLFADIYGIFVHSDG